jgi:ribosomal protein S27E
MLIFNQAAKAILDLTRKCPKCGREQVVPASRKNETIKCKICGADIPPKK